MNKKISLILLSVVVSLGMTAALAQNKPRTEVPYTPQSLEEAIHTPAIKDHKSHNLVAQYQLQQARILSEEHNLNVYMTRDDEVIIITIPADKLFGPNATALNEEAPAILRKYVPLVNSRDFYRIALAMYHDNTGSPQYCMDLTENRLQSIYDWFVLNADASHMSRFAMGQLNVTEPTEITPLNNSIENRRMNRRLEIYLIPGEKMLEQAKKNMLNLR